MSNRDSLGFGDLLPQDVVNIFVREKNGKRGRKKRTRSLGRAFGWLKRRKSRKLSANGQGPGLGPALDLALDGLSAGQQGGNKGGHKSTRHAHPQGNSHAVSKRENEDQTLAPPPFLENVFVEASRPKYLEDLHSEALEGLKLMQQEESSKGVEYQDNESTISTVTTQTDGESAGFVTDSTLPDSSSVVSAQSSVSAMSSRSGLTRQESTFRPLNSGRKGEKGKKRRRQRRTIVGIPHHVQRELGLDRTGWMLNPPLQEEHLYNGETDNGFTSDDQQNAESTDEAVTSITAVKNLQPLSKDNVEQLGATFAGHGDDLTLLHRFNSGLTRGQRPQSLAVPWMTTASSNQKLSPGAVMSMSPQAAYMSKIIPNAVLPPSIEVVEISRGQSRSSVRTVTKSSLVVSSPNSSRPSSRASSSRSTLSNITSASRCILPSTSGSSLWSNSESSETLVSDTSTIFSSSTAQQNKSPYGAASAKEDKVGPISSNYSQNGKIVLKGGEKNAQFGRSMSIKKPKRAPPPPSRSYSLHNKIKRRSRDLMELQPSTSGRPSYQSEENNNIIGLSSVPSKNGDSPGYHGDTSSLDESSASVVFPFIKPHPQEPKTEVRVEVEKVSKEVPREKQENKRNKTRPPPIGSSKQEPTPLKVSKEVQGSSTKHKKSIFAKWFSGSHSPAVPKAEAKVQEKPKLTEELNPEAGTASTHSSVRTLRDLFNIPPSPKVHAPPPPPPEVWAHSKRTFELIFGPPAPIDPSAIIKKNPKDRRHQRQSSSVSTESSTKGSVVERKHKNPAEKLEASDNQSFQESGDLRTECDDKKNNEELEQNEGLKEKDEKVRVGDVLNGMLVKVIERRQRTEENQNVFIEGKSSVGELPAPSIVSISSSSPPPESHLPHPCTGQTMDATSGQVVSPESFWPPPPPPLTQIGISGSDEADLPLPPPPLFGEEGLSSPSPPETKAARVDVITAKPKNLCPPEVMLSPLKIPPPPSYTAPPPPAEVSPQHEVVPAPKSEALPGKEVTTLATAAEEASLPPAVEAFHPLPHKVAPQTLDDAAPPSQEDGFQAITQAAPESKLTPPQSVPPPPPSLSQQQEEIPLEQEADSSNSIPPQIIPPPSDPPAQTLSEMTTASDEPPPSPPCDFRNSPIPKDVEEPAPSPPQSIPLPPPLPESGLVSTELQSSPVSQEDQSQKQMAAAALPEEPSSHITPSLLNAVKLRSVSSSPEPPEARQQTSDSHKEASPIITQTLLQTVKLRSVNNSPEPPEAKDQPETEVKLNQEQPENQAPTLSAPADPPQKPVRRSLILGASTSPSPPVDAAPQPTLPTSQSVSAPAATTVSIAKPSPPVAASRSMNLQEAIRMRTAARSKENPSSSLNLHPTSPSNLQKSPTSTANFIFSKINKKADDKTVLETKIQPRNQEVSSVTKIPSVEEPVKKEAKVPPPVAKKPRTESKGAEINEDTEQTAGQEAQKGVIEPEE
uniref:KIAA1522 n=1 Tax=Oryzias latipes TaxID=8090 RepID=A0A3P9JJ78_ORYLA